MGFIKKIFGLGGAGASSVFTEAEDIVEEQLENIIKSLQLSLSFQVSSDDEQIFVNFEGKDVKSLTEKEGHLLDALQFYVKRVIQHTLPEAKMGLQFDAEGYREEALKQLIVLADKLKGIALDKNKSVYFRALAPKDRKVIHQHLAKDDRVKSKSVGEGLFKKIKVFPVGLKNNKKRNNRNQNDRQNKDA